MKNSKKIILCIVMVLVLVMGTTVSSFADENSLQSNNLKSEIVTELGDIEFEVTKDDIDENGNFKIEIPQNTESSALSKGVITDDNSSKLKTTRKLPTIIVEGSATKYSWEGNLSGLRIGCKVKVGIS